MDKKIKTKEEIKKISEKLHQEGKIIVTVNGSYDIVHIGHVKSLEEAKNQGDVLIIGINSDESVKSYKGEKRPIITEQLRAEFLAALNCVDYVTIIGPETEIAGPLIRLVKPNIHANGSEYGEDCVEAEAVKEVGAKLFLIPKYHDMSTTKLIEKIRENYD